MGLINEEPDDDKSSADSVSGRNLPGRLENRQNEERGEYLCGTEGM